MFNPVAYTLTLLSRTAPPAYRALLANAAAVYGVGPRPAYLLATLRQLPPGYLAGLPHPVRGQLAAAAGL